MIPVLKELLARGELARAGYTSFLALTYGVDLPWFEHHVGRQLRLAGIRRFLILADGPNLNETLPSDLSDAPGAGSWYAVEAVRALGAFHPKAYLLAGPRAARLYVGSGNLTQSGLGRNLELFERWDATTAPEGLPEAMVAFGRFAYALLGQHALRATHLREMLDAIFGEPVFQPKPRPSPSQFLGSPSEVLPLLTAPSPARTLTLTAPFFDEHGTEAVAIAERLGALKFDVLVDTGLTNLTTAARDAIERVGGRIRAFDEARRSHAKALYAEGDGWALGVHGSANLSLAAWEGRNVELVVLRRNEAATVIRDLLEERHTREVGAEEWAAIAARTKEAPGEVAEATSPQLAVTAARWAGASTIEITCACAFTPSCSVRLRDCESERLISPSAPDGPRIRIGVPAEVERGVACAVRLENDGMVGGWVLVHDPEELRFQSRGRSNFDQRADAYLSSSRGDGEAAADFLEFLVAMDQERAEGAGNRTPSATTRDVQPKPEWAWVKEEDFAVGRESFAAPAIEDGAIREGEDVAAARLLKRLLFGSDRHGPPQDDDLRNSDGEAEAEGEGSRPTGARENDRVERQLDLHELVARATSAFISRLRRSEEVESPERLLRTLLVLVAALQDTARAGYIRDRALGEHLVRLVGEFLGRDDAPFPRSLAAIPRDDQRDAWSRSSFLIGAVLAIYNACLVTAVVQDASPSSPAFPEYRAALWARHVLRYAPDGDLADLVKDAMDRVPTLRRFGVLWVADRWNFEGLVSFEDFLKAVAQDALDIEAADDAVSAIRQRMVTGALPATDDDAIVGLGRDGRIAPGFIEDGRRRVLFDGAFQTAGEQDPVRRALQSSSTQVLPFDRIPALIPDLPTSAARGLALLRTMA